MNRIQLTALLIALTAALICADAAIRLSLHSVVPVQEARVITQIIVHTATMPTSPPQAPTDAPPLPTDTPQPTATAEPSATVEPSATAEPPTATIEPSATPDLRAAYFRKITPPLGLIAKGLGAIDDEFRKFRNLDIQAGWEDRIAGSIAEVRQGHQQIVDTQPPDEMRDYHGRLIDATKDCDTAMLETEKAMKESASHLEQAGDLMIRCAKKIDILRAEIQH